jgi:predicted dehydrogenase
MAHVDIRPGRRVRYGIVGTGSHLREHLLPSLRLVDGAEIAACSSRSLHRAEETARRWGAKSAFSSWQEMIDSGEVDAVVACGPPSAHCDVAAYCLERCIHVFVEKPPTMTADDLRVLVEAERANPRTVTFVGFNFPYGTTYRKVLDIVSRSGAPRLARLRFVSSKPRKPEWGCASVVESLLLAQGVHPINMATRLFGSASEVRTAFVELDDLRFACNLDVAFAGGAHATIELGNYAQRFEFRCELVNQAGVHAVLDQHNTLVFSGLPEAAGMGDLFGGKEAVTYSWPSRRGGFARTGYQTELDAFHHCITSGAPSDSRFVDAVAAYEVIDAAVDSLIGGDVLKASARSGRIESRAARAGAPRN